MTAHDSASQKANRISVLLLLIAAGHTVPAIGLFLWCAIVVGSADNGLRPRLVGKDTEMPDLLVLLSTFGGLALYGAVGLVIGPVIGALFVAITHICGDTSADMFRGAEAVSPGPGTSGPVCERHSVNLNWGTPGIVFGWAAAVVMAGVEPTFATLIG